MHDINLYNILGVAETRLEMAASPQCAIKRNHNRTGGLRPVKYVTPFFGAQSNHLHTNHVTQARKRRSVSTVARSGFTRHIAPDYPGRIHPSHSRRSHTLLTRDQNLISRKSPHTPRRPEDLTMTPLRRKLSTQPPNLRCGGGQ